jgi:hypothetical protein
MPDHRTRILAVTNQKGGVGKTTTAINLGAALARLNKRVLIVDLDPQGNASTGLGIVPSSRMLTTYDLLVDDASLRDIVLPTQFDGLFIAPATTDLSSTDVDLVDHENRVGCCARASRCAGHVLRRHPDRLPAVAQPSDGQCAGGGGCRAGAASDGVLRIGGVVATSDDRSAGARKRQPRPARRWCGADHVRPAQQPVPTGGGGCPRDAWASWSTGREFPRNVRVSEAPSYAFR